jgi:hypothetical protein
VRENAKVNLGRDWWAESATIGPGWAGTASVRLESPGDFPIHVRPRLMALRTPSIRPE